MMINQFAVYRVDQNSPGKGIWHKSYQEIREEHLSIRVEYYRKMMIQPMDEHEEVRKIRDRIHSDLEISDVLVLNRDGELSYYYVDESRLIPITGFIRINSAGAVILHNTEGYTFDGMNGKWDTIDEIIIDGNQFYLLEHHEFRDGIPAVIADAYGRLIADKCTQGFDQESKQKIKDYLREDPQKELKELQQTQVDQTKRLLLWQKYYQNGEYLRSVESGTESNYDMVDGRVNNEKQEEKPKTQPKTKPVQPQPMEKKKKKRTSVIKKLRQKQINIAIRDGKPVPKYLEHMTAQERDRR